jgi:hypothetical protein
VTLPVILQVFERIPPHLTVPEWIASSTGAVAYSLPGWEMYTTSISPCTPTPKAPEKELPPPPHAAMLPGIYPVPAENIEISETDSKIAPILKVTVLDVLLTKVASTASPPIKSEAELPEQGPPIALILRVELPEAAKFVPVTVKL